MSSPKLPTTTSEIREAFLQYFEQHGHQRVASSSLVPGNDPTLLFTNAGMVQFKDVFLGDEKRDYSRAVSSQRCVRAGGKHNDLENVGYTARHHTFFEMLGNFSFGDYFKKEAIPFGWNFLTEVLKLPKERLYVTVYAEDDEAYKIWNEQIGVPADRIIRIGDNKGARYASDNFWAMGDTGPCGPCTEIFFDHGDHIEGGLPGTPEEDGDRYIEVWNIVFMQFNRTVDGEMHTLPKPSVDTGMGLERIAAVMQHVNSNYDIDLFKALIAAVAQKTGAKDLTHNSLKVIADHIRSCAFLVVDGVTPSNEGRGYVLRRIIRRALRHGNKLGHNGLFFADLVFSLVQQMGEAYPELKDHQTQIEKALRKEEQQFAETLEQGLKIFEQDLTQIKNKTISGELAFKLYDTYGFPLDLTQDIARERGLKVDEAGYDKAMQGQRDRAKAASQFKSAALEKLDLSPLQIAKTNFTGYQELQTNAVVQAVYSDGNLAERVESGGDAVLVLDQTPFYAESGGQTGDQGHLKTEQGVFKIIDTQKQGHTFLHSGIMIDGVLIKGESVSAVVDSQARSATARHHSATHLLHAALRKVLGEHVTQKGSLVDDKRLRFDFSHPEPITSDQLHVVADMVSTQIRANTPVCIEEMDMESAKQKGAMALFGEKYEDQVRVLTMGDENFSIELCGGTHVSRTGDIGAFHIVSESGIASGVRRIEAVVGEQADRAITNLSKTLYRAAELIKSSPDQLPDKIQQMLSQQKELEKQLQQMQQKLASSMGGDLVADATDISGVKVLVATVDAEPKALRGMIDDLKQRLGPSVIVLAAKNNEKVSLVAGVSDENISKIKAGDIIKNLSIALGGKGGGKPQFAQGAGVDTAGLEGQLVSLKLELIAQLEA